MASRAGWMGWVGLLGLSGCIATAPLASDYANLKDDLSKAHGLTNCAPKDLAIADANAAFAQLEFDQGNVRRAVEHIRISREHLKVALACPAIEKAPPPPPKPAVVSIADTDRDTIPDPDDACPNDPEDLDAFLDADGCPDLDNDQDTIPDAIDACRNEPEDRDMFEDTDGCPDLDNDKDTIPDTLDQCPNEPGVPERQGCPILDTDGDGLNDAVDQCPKEPETKNEYKDEDGCPDTKPQRIEVTGEQIVIKQRINFASGKAVILKDSFPVLNDVAQVMKDYPNIVVEIQGHTDNQGDDNMNMKLSKARADAVFEYLVRQGIPASRMQTVGYGETRPIDTNMTDGGRLNNRRVEFHIVSGTTK